uniref:U6 snRNA phosphodiesterase n=1 Tax=Timema cristinae TaxID=61476 RepID=A0A7R9CY07_TIMCR|nr:unnamed protein product [Timema cristinae]
MSASSKGSLSLLSVYNHSDDSDEDYAIPGARVSVKRESLKEWSENKSKKVMINQSVPKLISLPPPVALNSLFLVSEDRPKDNPEFHQGRVRSFAHERGNWSTFVYVRCETNLVLQSFMDVVKVLCETVVPVPIEPVDEFHVSLTKTFVLKHHWIDSFIESVRQSITELSSFNLTFGSVQVYCNDEKTRTFIGLTVQVGQEALMACVEELDKCLAEFKLPCFYEDPSFHLSVAWCSGDHEQSIRSILPQLNVAFTQFTHTHPDKWTIHVKQLFCNRHQSRYIFSNSTQNCFRFHSPVLLTDPEVRDNPE